MKKVLITLLVILFGLIAFFNSANISYAQEDGGPGFVPVTKPSVTTTAPSAPCDATCQAQKYITQTGQGHLSSDCTATSCTLLACTNGLVLDTYTYYPTPNCPVVSTSDGDSYFNCPTEPPPPPHTPVPPVSPTPTPPPACGTSCVSDYDCHGTKDTCTSCVGHVCSPPVTATPSPIPSPTPPPACGSSCVKDSDCTTSSSLACPVCSPAGVCVPVASPTPKVPACGTPCSSSFDCAGTKDSCTFCGSGGICTPPLPSSTPVPTSTPFPTSTPAPSATPTMTPIPFNPAVCHCDGIDYSSLVSGQSVTITSHAKVEGADTSTAKIADQSFYLYEGAEVDTTRIGSSGPIPASIVSSSPSLVKYDSKWTFTLPQLKNGATYRIQSVPNCQPANTAMNYIPQTPKANAVLGTSTTQNQGIFASIFNFFASILGVGPKTTTIVASPTKAPNSISVNTESDIEPTKSTSLQLTTFQPVEVYQKTCTFIKFKYQQL